MLTGEELGRAIKAAIEKKGVTQKAVAVHFRVKPPSIQDWIKRGVIGKDKLPELWRYFADVVGPEHWGLKSWPAAPNEEAGELPERPGWPFSRVTIDQWNALTPADKGRVEGYVEGLLAGAAPKGRKSHIKNAA